ncbi:hypothetical protein LARV_03072 [Longilinea arvoryzae]|uniref:YvlB/LiaX N-terminal domain-containing protein n=1 Tax=Longilinea arvoryzae TaxID=360412 RepID=A0A0S7BLS8_9CHLR|nr:hypothetical protein [Longilinea arvoryzae]GAP15288.1 hypothetical protein LARV_03072 [Longilinea arvoryzae]
MFTQTLTLTNEKEIELKVDRDLELRGWDQPGVEVSVPRESDLTVKTVDEKLIIESFSNLKISVPQVMQIRIRKVEGDADIQDLTGLLTILGIGGDLDLDSTGETRIDAIGGDLDANKTAALDVTAVGGDAAVKHVPGAVKITNVGGDLDAESLGSLQLITVGGDCNVRKIEGEFSVANVGGDLNGADLAAQISAITVGGDLNLRIKQGGVKAMAGGDQVVSLNSLTGEPIHLSAGGDVNLHLPIQASAKMHISSGGRDILMRVGGWNERVEMFTFDFTLGEGTTPIQITAGGDVMVTDSSAETRKGSSTFEFGGVKVDVDAISQTVQDVVERASRSAEIASREVEERIQAAMRRVEEQNRRRGIRVGFDGFPGASPVPPVAPVATPPSTPPQGTVGRVSDEERKMILQMLQDHRITADEAIHLLDTLEGKNQ